MLSLANLTHLRPRLLTSRTPLINDDNESSPRRNHIFGCFDSKGGTILVNAVYIIFVATKLEDSSQSQVADQETIDAIHANYVISMIVYGVSIAMALVAIIGAYIYTMYLVLLGAVWALGSQTYLDVTTPDWHWYDWWIFFTLIMIYPMLVFAYEVKNGIMSPQTYPRQRHCCYGYV